MANLIEQMNVLKGLRDEDLTVELQQPSGRAPPFLVATEIQRRKDMRQRYEGEQARRKPRTTVLEDLVSNAMPPMPAMQSQPAGAPPPSTGGLDAAVGFADGGMVDLNDIAARYNKRLESLSGDRDRARAMALLAASAGILGGGSSNFGKNLGAGMAAGIDAYNTGIKTVDSEETDLLRNLADIGQAQNSNRLADMDRTFRERELDLQEQRLTTERKPTDVLTFEYYQSLDPAGKAEYERLNPAYNPNALTNDMRKIDDANKVFENALKAIPEPTIVEPGKEIEVAREQQKQAAILAYPRWVSILGPEGAAAMARQYGLTDGDLLLSTGSGSGGAVLDEKDPLGLGL